MLNLITIEENTATITINGKPKSVLIDWKEGMPALVESLWVGVKIGKTGKKVWLARLKICRNTRYKEGSLSGSSEWLVSVTNPLNSINHGGYNTQIVGWWEDIDDKIKSER